MPRRLTKKDCVDISFAYRVGLVNNKPKYTEAMTTQAQIILKSGSNTVNHFGTAFNYDKIVMVQKNNQTKFIDEFSKIWLTSKPSDSKAKADTIIERINENRSGIIVIYCSTAIQNNSSLWFANADKEIIQIKGDIDLEKLTFRIPVNMFVSFDNNTKIWTKRPLDYSDTRNIFVFNEIIDKKTYREVRLKHGE